MRYVKSVTFKCLKHNLAIICAAIDVQQKLEFDRLLIVLRRLDRMKILENTNMLLQLILVNI